jgi:hypothetical protein
MPDVVRPPAKEYDIKAQPPIREILLPGKKSARRAHNTLLLAAVNRMLQVLRRQHSPGLDLDECYHVSPRGDNVDLS